MIQSEVVAPWQQPDPTQYAAMSFLARYRGDTLRAYRQDLRYFLRWCAERAVEPLQAQRPHLELYLRWMEQQGLAPATIGRRFTTVAGFYRYAVIDGHCHKDPSLAVTRPRVPWEGQRRTVLHPLEYVALLTAARRDTPTAHTLVALLGMIGLSVGEAVGINVTDLRSQSGYELLTIMGKGAKPALIPLPVPVLRAVRDTVAGRSAGPLLLNQHGNRLSRSSAASLLTRLARSAGLTQPLSPTLCAGPSAPPGWSAACRCGICSTPCDMPTAAPPCATTWPAPTSTGTQPTPSRPTLPA